MVSTAFQTCSVFLNKTYLGSRYIVLRLEYESFMPSDVVQVNQLQPPMAWLLTGLKTGVSATEER